MKANRSSHLLGAYHILQSGLRNPEAISSIQQGWHEWSISGALRWVFAPAPSLGQAEEGLLVGVGEDVQIGRLPSFVLSPFGHEPVPLRAVRSAPCIMQTGGSNVCGVRSLSCDLGRGSVGAFARDAGRSRHFALTAAHVVAGGADASIRDRIEISGSRNVTGTLDDWCPVMGRREVTTGIDIALVALDVGDVDALINDSAGLPTGLAELRNFAARVTLRRIDGPLQGRFKGWWTGWVGGGGMRGGYDYLLQDGVTYDLEAPYSKGGDSGAGLWDEAGRLVAFHCGFLPENESGWNGIGCTAKDVFDFFRIELLMRNGGIAPATQAVSGTTSRVETARSLRVANPTVAPVVGTPLADIEVDTLARTLWGEARGEGRVGMEAVASVILNRLHRQNWWGKSISAVCRRAWQFSCWNQNAPGLKQLMSITASDPEFRTAVAVANEAVKLQLPDITKRATHYYASYIPAPRWARGKTPCCSIGRHLFFNDID